MTARSKVGAVIFIAALSGCGGGGGGFAPGALGANGNSGGSPVIPQPPVATSTPVPVVAHYPLTVSPAVTRLSAPGDVASLTANENNYGGKLITYTGGCAGIASVSPPSETADSSGSAIFKITALKSNASCRPIFSDTYGQSGSSLANVGAPPSPAPTVKPTAAPVPTMAPTSQPMPTSAPTASPVQPTATPVPVAPSPTSKPTIVPASPVPVPTVAPTAQPTQPPTPAPTATPATNYGPLTVSPDLSLGNGNPDSGSFTVSESNYTAAFGESDNCSGIATVTPPAGGAFGPSSVFAVQDENGGTCTVTFTDNHGGSVSREIVVTTFGIILQSKHRSGGAN